MTPVWTTMQISEPTALPVSIGEARQQVRALSTAEDQQIDGYIRAAMAHIEKSAARCFMPQVWEMALDAFPTDPMALYPGPAVSVTSVTYWDGAADVILATTGYSLGVCGLSAVTAWPGGSNVRIRFTAGRGSPPADIKQAVLLLAGWYYDNRAAAAPSPSVPIEFGVEALVGRHRLHFV